MWAGSARGNSPAGAVSESDPAGAALDGNFERETEVPIVIEQPVSLSRPSEDTAQ